MSRWNTVGWTSMRHRQALNLQEESLVLPLLLELPLSKLLLLQLLLLSQLLLHLSHV